MILRSEFTSRTKSLRMSGNSGGICRSSGLRQRGRLGGMAGLMPSQRKEMSVLSPRRRGGRGLRAVVRQTKSLREMRAASPAGAPSQALLHATITTGLVQARPGRGLDREPALTVCPVRYLDAIVRVFRRSLALSSQDFGPGGFSLSSPLRSCRCSRVQYQTQHRLPLARFSPRSPTALPM
jgi:hypothetical protein